MMPSYMARSSSRDRLVPTVGCMSFRNPALLAKMFTTLDYVSNGRIIAGIGAGWLPSEYEAYGYRYPPTRERIAQLDEGVRIRKAMLTRDGAVFQGRYVHIDGAGDLP